MYLIPLERKVYWIKSNIRQIYICKCGVVKNERKKGKIGDEYLGLMFLSEWKKGANLNRLSGNT